MAKIVYVSSKPQTQKAYIKAEEGAPEEDRTWFEHRKMLEEDYQKYVDLTSRIKLGKGDDPAEMDMMLGTTRMYLLKTLAVDWNAEDDSGKKLPLTEVNLKKMPPNVISDWVEDIYQFNEVLRPEKADSENEDLSKKVE